MNSTTPQPITIRPVLSKTAPKYYYGVLIQDKRIGDAPHFDDVMHADLDKAIAEAVRFSGYPDITVLSIIRTDTNTGETKATHTICDIEEMCEQRERQTAEEAKYGSAESQWRSDYYANCL